RWRSSVDRAVSGRASLQAGQAQALVDLVDAIPDRRQVVAVRVAAELVQSGVEELVRQGAFARCVAVHELDLRAAPTRVEVATLAATAGPLETLHVEPEDHRDLELAAGWQEDLRPRSHRDVRRFVRPLRRIPRLAR